MIIVGRIRSCFFSTSNFLAKIFIFKLAKQYFPQELLKGKSVRTQRFVIALIINFPYTESLLILIEKAKGVN